MVQAIEDFKERVVPVFTKVDTQEQELAKLRDDLRKLRQDKIRLEGKLRKTGPLRDEILQVKLKLSETEQNTEEALRLSENLKVELDASHVTATQWKTRATKFEQESKRYKDMLDRQANNVSPAPKPQPLGQDFDPIL